MKSTTKNIILKNTILDSINKFISKGLNISQIQDRLGLGENYDMLGRIQDEHWKNFNGLIINFDKNNIAKILKFENYFNLNIELTTNELIEIFGYDDKVYKEVPHNESRSLYYNFDNFILCFKYERIVNSIKEIINDHPYLFEITF